MTRIDVPERDIVAIRAPNPGPFTLSGTNTWVVGRDPAWMIDPGPLIEAHLEALSSELEARGGLGGVALTHHHSDHDEAVPALRERFPGLPVAGSGAVDVRLSDGSVFGPLRALSTPGHAPDHLAFALDGDVVFTGDAVLGEGSVFITPYPGALRSYLDALERLRHFHFRLLAPGHGPLVTDVDEHLARYVAHRLEREQRLIAALHAGGRTVDQLLDDAWSDAPAALRPAAAATLAAHLDKLVEEGRLPDGVERPQISL
jgi:glyoxylase-like metal-dependent hydrolase (beta-lactamase superfamily II)